MYQRIGIRLGNGRPAIKALSVAVRLVSLLRLATHRSDRALQLKIKVPTGADLYAVFIVAAAVIVIWGWYFLYARQSHLVMA